LSSKAQEKGVMRCELIVTRMVVRVCGGASPNNLDTAVNDVLLHHDKTGAVYDYPVMYDRYPVKHRIGECIDNILFRISRHRKYASSKYSRLDKSKRRKHFAGE
jgi:hypothetical protein